MAKYSCVPDPSEPDYPYNAFQLFRGNGDVEIKSLWQHDGTSVYPDCAGTVQSIRVRNSSPDQSWDASFPNSGKTITLAPGFDQTFTGGNLKNQGLDLYDRIKVAILRPTP